MFEFIKKVEGIVRAYDLINGGIWTGTEQEFLQLGGIIAGAQPQEAQEEQ